MLPTPSSVPAFTSEGAPTGMATSEGVGSKEKIVYSEGGIDSVKNTTDHVKPHKLSLESLLKRYKISDKHQGPRPYKFQNPGLQYKYDAPTKSWAMQELMLQNVTRSLNHIFNTNGHKESIDSLLKGSQSKIWSESLSNELGRLAQGVNSVKGNDVVDFIPKSDVPTNRIVTYANMICDYRPHKSEKFRVRLTVGGDRLVYDDDAASPAASLLETKLLLNSTISDASKGARFMTLDIKDFFLQTVMERPEYMRIHSKYFLQEMREKYKIDSIIAPDGYVYCKIKRGMYGLKQAARLAYDKLRENLKMHGYSPDKYSPNIWVHEHHSTKFCLCVDDFGVKYTSQKEADHLIGALQESYDITIDKSGKSFCGLDLEWNYEKDMWILV